LAFGSWLLALSFWRYATRHDTVVVSTARFLFIPSKLGMFRNDEAAVLALLAFDVMERGDSLELPAEAHSRQKLLDVFAL
jgi:hypothetical protein